MEKSRNSASSSKDSSGVLRLIHSVQALIPATGNPAAGTDTSAKQTDENNTMAKQAAASLIPALGDSKDTQNQTEETDKKSASKIFTWLKKLLCASSGIMVIGVQAFTIISGIQYLKKKRKEYISRQKWEKLEKAVKGANPNYSTGELQWKNNCQRCVSAFEARMRGRNVTARPRCMEIRDELAYPDKTTGLFSVYKSPDILDVSSDNCWDCEEKIRRHMEEWGEGARAIVVVYWERGGGHAFNAVQINEDTAYVDPQTGNMHCYSYFEHIDTSKKVFLCRTDDQEFTDRLDLCIQEEEKE